MAKLTALQVKHAKKGRHAAGQGLYLLVREGGSRSWLLRTQVDGKRRDLGLGSADRISLAQARIDAAHLLNRVKRGEDPHPQPEPVKLVAPTFAEAARACHRALKSGWKNARHRDSWLGSLELHIHPKIGSVPVDEVTSAMVRNALAPIWLTIPESARRILQRIRTVLDYAHIEGWCKHEASLRSVPKGLPRQPTVENHYIALPYAEAPALIAKVNLLPQTAGRDALLFTIYNAVRSGETRFATWDEFNLETGVWTIPAIRMKMNKEHIVPLAPKSVEILRQRWKLGLNDSGYIFTNCGRKPLCDMTMTKVLRDMDIKHITVHGFRSSFTDWAAETTDFAKEIVDKALAHKLVDRVEAAYRRTDFFEHRRKLMSEWALFLENHGYDGKTQV